MSENKTAAAILTVGRLFSKPGDKNIEDWHTEYENWLDVLDNAERNKQKNRSNLPPASTVGFRK
jgi:hypothetical protein